MTESEREMECRKRFDIEGQRRTVALEQLWRIADQDPTVRAFIEAWRHGSFPSFEEMLCQLSAQLATEKAEYLKTATKALSVAPDPDYEVVEKKPNGSTLTVTGNE